MEDLSKEELYTVSYKTESLETCIRQRHSVREYLPKEVDQTIIEDCLRLAQLAPSNSNIQNWRLLIASGAGRERIVKALMKEATTGDAPNIPPLPEKYRHFRSELGRELYGAGGYGIPRSDKEARDKAVLRNYEFFGAPVIAIIAQDPALANIDSLSSGMWLQTFILALTEQGLGTCVEVSVAGYPEVLKREFGTDLDILCGLAIGWPSDSKLNRLHTGRGKIEDNVKWVKE
ncbi:MAG: hypothetical protein GOMPHAMPRED_003802 [Gomphillus americanus]|uniref:Nitroreductase domain-containing protein n=1 Tax=Gomphillus americanus TaxID=1940652 RepID=A0A8H3FJU5_9LECA|nr:MAG: hypothetical protein GOMPHAMPRED_003802 [Gomphillus americanus]